MALIGIYEIVLAFVCFAIGCWLSNRTEIQSNWPVVGMLPSLLANVYRLHDWTLGLVEKSGGTFHFKGPWFINMDIVGTVDPANVKHMMSVNFTNYPKGSEYKEMFDIFGDGIFNTDSELWRTQRKAAVALINHERFRQFLNKVLRAKVQKGLIPVLEHVSKQGLTVDIQDLFHRFSLDITTKLVTGFDRESLSIELSDDEVAVALDNAEEVIFYRHVRPKMFWKLQRWLGLGVEKKMKIAWETMDRAAAKYIARRRQQLMEEEVAEDEFDLMGSYIKYNVGQQLFRGSKSDDEFLRDTIFSFLVAGRENSLAWFFWLLSENPQAEAKIREELNSLLPENKVHEGPQLFDLEKLNKLLYLHGALCETLRLYPPVMFEHKEPLQPDILPSGHHVDPRMKILVSTYLMGRMKSIWGEDCLEFKPERWISKADGRLVQHPPHKFMAFNAGPRTCLGKDIALLVMKIVAAILLQNYNVEVVKEHPVAPNCASIILHIKHGLMARISRRWTSN